MTQFACLHSLYYHLHSLQCELTELLIEIFPYLSLFLREGGSLSESNFLRSSGCKQKLREKERKIRKKEDSREEWKGRTGRERER